MLVRRTAPQLEQFALGWGPAMKSLLKYGLAGLIFFTAGAAVDPGIRPQEQLSDDCAANETRTSVP